MFTKGNDNVQKDSTELTQSLIKEALKIKTDTKTMLFSFLYVIYIFSIGIRMLLFSNNQSLNTVNAIILDYYTMIVFVPCMVFTIWKFILLRIAPEFKDTLSDADFKNMRIAFEGFLAHIVIYVMMFISINASIEVATASIGFIDLILTSAFSLNKFFKNDLIIKISAISRNLSSLTTMFFAINLIGLNCKYIPILIFKLIAR